MTFFVGKQVNFQHTTHELLWRERRDETVWEPQQQQIVERNKVVVTPIYSAVMFLKEDKSERNVQHL